MTAVLEARRVGDALSLAARGGRRGYVFGEREVGFAEIDAAAARFAAGLLRLGFARGDRLALNAPNLPEWLIAYFGAAMIGVVTVGLNVRYRDSELAYILGQSEVRAVVSVARLGTMDHAALLGALRPRLPHLREIVLLGEGGEAGQGVLRFADVAGRAVTMGGPERSPQTPPLDDHDREALARARAEVRPDDPVLLIYTSGTTGRPKGATLTHKSQLASARAQVRHMRMNPNDVFPVVLPLSHVGGITCGVIAALLAECTTVLIPAFDAGEVIRQANAWGATIFGGVPTMCTLLLRHPEVGTLGGGRVRVVLSGGANADPPLLHALHQAFPGATVMNLYGLSECSGGVAMTPWDADFDTTVRSVGRPLNGVEVRVIGDGGALLPPGAVGELCFRGEGVVAGYFGMPAETAETFDPEGWLHTGDLGFVDDHGMIVLMGRLKDLYIQGGFNVYPVEVENLIARLPAVALVAGIGVPDPVLGEIGRYYVVPRPGAELGAEEILAHCREHLADYKVPRQIVIRPELPLTPAGKIMKSRLREEG